MGALISCAYSLRTAEGDWTFDPAFLRTTLKTALPVVPLAVGLWTLQSSDYFFVSYYRGPSGVAIYGLAYSLASITLLALAAANLTYLPTCVEILRKGRAPFALFIDDSTRFFLVGGVAAIAFAAAAGPQLAGWLAGAAYVDSGRLLPVVVGAYVCFSLGQMQQFVPAAMTQDMKGSARAHGWAALANVMANFILVPRFGLWGAAWSTVTAYALALFLLTRSVHSLLPELGWPRKLGAMAVLLVMATGFALLVQFCRSRGGINAQLLFLEAEAVHIPPAWVVAEGVQSAVRIKIELRVAIGGVLIAADGLTRRQ